MNEVDASTVGTFKFPNFLGMMTRWATGERRVTDLVALKLYVFTRVSTPLDLISMWMFFANFSVQVLNYGSTPEKLNAMV